jgi:quinol monooxygenase YgiN
MTEAGPGYVVHVEFETAPGDFARFKEMIAANARASVRDEPGCRQFDVLLPRDMPNRVVLYEVYDDEAAFEAHLASAHFKDFAARSGPLVTHRRIVVLDMLSANRKGA